MFDSSAGGPWFPVKLTGFDKLFEGDGVCVSIQFIDAALRSRSVDVVDSNQDKSVSRQILSQFTEGSAGYKYVAKKLFPDSK
jgi:hypothetical protein